MIQRKFRCVWALFLILFSGTAALQAQPGADTPGGALQGGAAKPGVLTVQVARSQIRAAPSVIAPILATVEYRTKVIVYENRDGWAKVQVPGTTRIGYMFLSALTEKTISSSDASKAASGVTGTEIALAGKGFNESVEESYRKNSHVDYSWVDVMEDFSYSSEALVGFLTGASAQ